MSDLSQNFSEEQEKTFRAQAWAYFALHAGQRMQSFQYYVTLVTALIAGLILVSKSGRYATQGALVICSATSILSYVFWKLDCRTRALIKNAESALQFMDRLHALPDIAGLPHPVKLFDRDAALRSSRGGWVGYVTGDLSYSRCLNIVYVVFGGGAIAVAAMIYFGR